MTSAAKERKRYERRDSSDDEESFREGDKVEAKIGGKSRRPGKIRRPTPTAPTILISRMAARAQRARRARPQGQKVGEKARDRAEVKIKSKWVKGKVKRTHKDGTLDVDASNGEKAASTRVAATTVLRRGRLSRSATVRGSTRAARRSTTASSRRRIPTGPSHKSSLVLSGS